NSEIGDSSTSIDITTTHEIYVQNNSTVYGDLTAAEWGTNITIDKDDSSVIYGVCDPNYGEPCSAPPPSENNCDEINELASYGIIGETDFQYGNNSEINGNDIDGEGNTPTPTGSVTTVDDLVFPPIDPPTFPSTGGEDITDQDTIVEGSYGKIIVGQKGNHNITTFSGGTYYIEELEIKQNKEVVFAPGKYFISVFKAENNTVLSINPEGKVEIYIGKSLQIGNKSDINADGNVEDLIFYMYGDASFQLGNNDNKPSNINFKGSIYAPSSDSRIEFGNNQYFQGSILSAGSVQVGNNTTFDYSTEVQQAIVEDTFGCEFGSGGDDQPTNPVIYTNYDSSKSQPYRMYTQIAGREFDIVIKDINDTKGKVHNISIIDRDYNTELNSSNTAKDLNDTYQTNYRMRVNNASRDTTIRIVYETNDENITKYSDDNFSIRPATYSFNDISYTENPRADEATKINLNITATEDSNSTTKDYNTTNFDKNINLNVIVPEDGNCPISNPSTSYSFIPTDGNFSDGVLQNDLNLSIADVGEYNATLDIIDTSWTSVDSLTGDCIPDSNSTTPDANGKVGCNISSSKEFKVKVYPHHFDVGLDGKQSYINPNSSNGVIYYGQGMDDNLTTTYLEQNITITAQNESNETTYNYDAQCFAPQDTKLDINISLENREDYPLMIGYIFSDDGSTYSSPTMVGSTKKFSIDVNDSNTTYDNGVSQAYLRMSVDVNQSSLSQAHGGVKTPINPMKLDGSSTDNNISVTAIMSDDGVDINGSSNANLSFGTNVIYYFGRLTPIDAQTTEDDVNVTFYVDVYCKDCNSSQLSNFNLDASKKSVKYPASWYINKNEDSLDINKSDLIPSGQASGEIVINNDIDFSGGEGKINVSKSDTDFYGKAKVDIDLEDSNQTFIYYNPYSDTNITRFYIDFMEAPEGTISEDVIDNQGKDSESGRRLRW
ncbi:MAG: hypothetical protein ACOC08_00320, partial [Campylobacterales bacterium]